MLLLYSCTTADEFDKPQYRLDGNLVGSSDFFGEPTSVISDDGLFILADGKMKDNFHLLDEDFNLIKSFGKVGNGPSEISLRVQILPIQSFNKNPFRVMGGSSMKELDLNRASDNFKLSNYPKDLVMTQSFIYINDTTVWGQGGSDQFKFISVNTNNGEALQEIPFGYLGGLFPQENLFFAFNGNGFYHPWWNRVVWSHISINIIEFYFPDGNFDKEWTFGAPWTEEELNRGYPVLLRSVPVPKGILVMHIKEAKELSENSTIANLYYAAIAKIKTRILFFNEDGEVKWSLKLDRFLNDFTFDGKNNRIVGVFGGSEEQNIVVYDLPKELLKDIGF